MHQRTSHRSVRRPQLYKTESKTAFSCTANGDDSPWFPAAPVRRAKYVVRRLVELGAQSAQEGGYVVSQRDVLIHFDRDVFP